MGGIESHRAGRFAVHGGTSAYIMEMMHGREVRANGREGLQFMARNECAQEGGESCWVRGLKCISMLTASEHKQRM